MKRKNAKIWHELYSYEGEVYGFIKSAVGNGDIARDLYQDVYLTVLMHIEKLDSDRSIKNWLYTVTRNRLINYLRSHRRREFELIDNAMLKEKLIEAKDDDLVDTVLDQLPARQRKILILREKEGWGYESLAKKLNLSLPAATSLLKRARENFQKNYLMQFLPDWFAHSAKSIALADVFRFINPFDPPLNLVEIIDKKCHQYFAKVQQAWDDIRGRFIEIEHLKSVLQKHIDQANLRILDCGAGTGAITKNLAENGHRILAIDIQLGMVQRLNTIKNRDKINALLPIQADIRHLPVRPHSIDIILFIFILHHLPAPIEMIQRSFHLLNKRGKIIIIDFLRHDDVSIADEMGDLWMGFDPDMLIKASNKHRLKNVSSGTFTESKQLKSFYLVFEQN